MKERLIYIDQIRGIAILLVIMGHLIENLYGHNSVFAFIYSFHMPLFFIISGYIGFKTVHVDSFKSYNLFLKKKFTTILLPFLFWTLIVRRYFFIQEWTILSMNDFINAVLSWNGLWFLKSLFEILVIYGLFHWISTKFNVKKNFFMDIIILLLPVLIIGLGIIFIDKSSFISLLLYTFFFYFGVFISKYNWIEKFIMNSYVFECCLCLFMIIVCHWVYGGNVYDDLYKIIISVSIFIAIMNICRRMTWNPFVSSQIITFGKYSLAIYVEHFCLIKIFANNEMFIEMNPFILFFVIAIIAIILSYLCIGFAKIIEKTRVLNLLMFGKY
jgi:fucose 4-O-acetylase-like acetyltransferase